METSLLIPLILWALSGLFVFFRRDISIWLRLLPLLFLTLACLYWLTELKYAYAFIAEGQLFILWKNITGLVNLLFMSLFVIWPVILILIFILSQPRDARVILLFMCIYSLVVTVLYFWLNISDIFSTSLK